MAYVDQEKKAKITAALKAVMPKDWKYSLAVRHHSTIVCTIKQAPVNLIEAFKQSDYFDPQTAGDINVNPYHYRDWIEDKGVADTIGKIISALNTNNHDRSDITTDYFDVGHYVDLHIGRWNKPFVYAH